MLKRKILAFIVAGLWISFAEFLRNELLFKSHWLEKYGSLGLQFPSEIINNAMWGAWSFLMALVIVYLSTRLRLLETIGLVWITAFVMMWIVIGNLNVLPYPLLVYAVPLSLLEVVVAVLLSRMIQKKV